MAGASLVLIYLYSKGSPDSNKIPVLRRDALLVPPLLTNRLPWSRGYFLTLKNVPLTRWDVLPCHVFERSVPPYYVDEDGNPVSEWAEPVGRYAIQSFRTIDDMVSRALGIPLAPD